MLLPFWDFVCIRAARRYRRKFKSGCTPIFLYVFSADPQRLFLLLYIYIYIYIYIFFLIKKEERERRLERGKNDHRNPAGNRTRDLSLSGRLLFRLEREKVAP